MSILRGQWSRLADTLNISHDKQPIPLYAADQPIRFQHVDIYCGCPAMLAASHSVFAAVV